MNDVDQNISSFVRKVHSIADRRLIVKEAPIIMERAKNVPVVWGVTAAAIAGVGWLAFKAAHHMQWAERVNSSNSIRQPSDVRLR